MLGGSLFLLTLLLFPFSLTHIGWGSPASPPGAEKVMEAGGGVHYRGGKFS